jgi:hypothetical protein
MSYVTREPGILVADLLSGGYEGVRTRRLRRPFDLLSRKTRVSGLPRVSAAPEVAVCDVGCRPNRDHAD